jgi:asparagine N-glycosylation enzyme membrane subunit Stt3
MSELIFCLIIISFLCFVFLLIGNAIDANMDYIIGIMILVFAVISLVGMGGIAIHG